MERTDSNWRCAEMPYHHPEMFATAAMIDSQCLQELKARDPNRAGYIVHSVRSGGRPLLRRPQS